MGKPVNLEITIRYPDQTERMIKKFNRKIKKSGLLDEVKDRRYYTKKSVKRRLKRLKKRKSSQDSTNKYKEKFKD